MIKKIFIANLVLLISNIQSIEIKTSASAASSPLQYKVIKGRKVVTESVEGKDIEFKMVEIRNRLEKDIKKTASELEKDMKDFQAKVQSRLVDREELEKMNARNELKKKELEVKAEAAQNEFQRTVNNEFGKFNVEMKKTVAEVAKSKNWDVVQLEETGEIIYTSDRVDATSDVIKAHDAKYKSKKAAASEKSKKAAA